MKPDPGTGSKTGSSRTNVWDNRNPPLHPAPRTCTMSPPGCDGVGMKAQLSLSGTVRCVCGDVRVRRCGRPGQPLSGCSLRVSEYSNPDGSSRLPRTPPGTPGPGKPVMLPLYKKYLFIYLPVLGLVVAHRHEDLVSQPGIEPQLLALGVRSFSHWTSPTQEVRSPSYSQEQSQASRAILPLGSCLPLPFPAEAGCPVSSLNELLLLGKPQA